ncbi:MAG: DUF4230 domain-containing protein [Anaerolinea sp.]
MAFGLVGAAAIILTVNLIGEVLGGIFNISAPPVEAAVLLSENVSSTLIARAQLVTAEKTIRDFQARVNVTGGIGNALGYGATYETDVVVKIGYDFSRPEFKVEPISENRIRVTMPRAELLSCSMTPPTEVDRSMSLTADWQAAKQLGEFMLMRGAVNEVLDSSDNFDGARASAQQTITQIVRSLSPTAQVEFVFLETPTERRMDNTCRLRQPLMWQYDPERDVWMRG